MREAIKNLALISLGCILVCLMAGFYVREKYLASPVKAPIEHPFLAFKGPWIIAHPGLEAGAKENVSKLPDSIVFWSDVRIDASDRVLAKAPDGSERLLVDLVKSQPNRRWVLNFSGNRPGMTEAIIAAVDATGAGDRILVQSPEDGLLKELREKRPRWIFGTSRRQTTIMTMLASIGLEPAAPIRGDVYVAEWDKSMGRVDLPERIVREAHRRNLRVIAGPVAGKSEVEALFRKGVDGALVSRPAELVDQATR